MGKRKTHEEYVEELKIKNPTVEVVGKYVNSHTKIMHHCLIHDVYWKSEPSNVLQGHGCKQCGKEKISANTRKTHDGYVLELSIKNSNIVVLEEYKGTDTKILHKCKIDGYEWKVTPASLLNGSGCPVCSGRVAGNAPEYKNSIWSSEYRDYFSKYMTEKQMKQYTPHSSQKTSIVCPDCKKIKIMSVDRLFQSGVGCECGDGHSYPNKFMYSLLNQLKIEYEPEYSPNWANGKLYDIYIPSINCIIENHGEQHYYGWSGNEKDLKRQQDNDKNKKDIAYNNGVKYYIELDCRKSNVKWIKKKIMNSAMPSLFGFSKNDIDWTKCEEFAVSNLVKISADLWNKKWSVKKIANKLNMSIDTIRKHLIKADGLNWCNYSGEESRFRSYKNVIRLSDGKIYRSAYQALKENGIPQTTFYRNLKNKNNFMYYDDYLKNI